MSVLPSVLLLSLSRYRPSTSIWIAFSTATIFFLRGSTIVVPFVPGNILITVGPLLPLILSMQFVLLTRPRMSECEQMASRVRLRTGLAVYLLCLAAAGCVLLLGPAGDTSYAVLSRNFLMYLGFGLLCAVLVGAELAWMPAGLLMTLLVFVGKNRDNSVNGWAIPLQPSSSGIAMVGAVVLFVGGSALAVRFDTKGMLFDGH